MNLRADAKFIMCFCVVSVGGTLSRQASLPNQRHHTLARVPPPRSPHHAPHTDDSYTLYASTHPALPRQNGLDQHPGTDCSNPGTQNMPGQSPWLSPLTTADNKNIAVVISITCRSYVLFCGKKNLSFPVCPVINNSSDLKDFCLFIKFILLQETK